MYTKKTALLIDDQRAINFYKKNDSIWIHDFNEIKRI